MLNRDMLYRGDENSHVLIRVGITLMVGLLGLAAGLWLGSTVLDSSGNKISSLQSDLDLAGLESQALVEEVASSAKWRKPYGLSSQTQRNRRPQPCIP